MEISYSKTKRPPYINFRMRKLIFQSMFEKTGDKEISQRIAEETEKIVTSNFWIKDMRKDVIKDNVISINKKVA